jgi:5'-3' exonuclease
MKNLLIDLSLIAHASLFSLKDQLAIGGYQILKHVLVKSIISNILEYKPDRVYICYDSGASWRKQISETYKAQRKEAREKLSDDNGGDIKWSEFYRILDELYTDFKVNFPFHVIRSPSVEADDIAAYIVKTSSPDDTNIIITRDGDYVQLLKYPNTKVFDPIKRKWMSSVNPEHSLQVKICMGDKSDNISAIQPRMGIATAEKFVESGALDKMLTEARIDIEQFGKPRNAVAVAYFKNEKLIDLSKAPSTIVDKIKTEINNSVVGNPSLLLKFFVTNGLRELLDDISKIRMAVSNLK